MTLDEKIGQLVQRMGGRSKSLNSRLGPEELDKVRRGEVGSYLHVAGADALRELQRVAVEESRLGIPLLFSMDVVHGYRTIFPVPLAMAASWDPEVAERHARIAATEASAAGLHWTFAPMVDIARDPRWGRIVEGAGEDAYLGSRMAAAQVVGFQGADLSAADTIMAGTKHFGAYGAAEGGRDYAGAEVSERAMRETYLAPFRAAAEAGSASYMTAFNALNGVPTTGNEDLLRTMLREEWGWNGLLLSDWRAVEELMAHGVAETRSDAARLALEASVDMDMVADVYAGDLKQAIEGDQALVPLLDQAVRRILDAKRKLGLFDDPYKYHDAAREAEVMLSPDHRAAARDIAERSMVLLKNEGDVLPVAKGAQKNWPAEKRIRWLAAHNRVPAADRKKELGTWMIRSTDDGVTWSPRYDSLVNSPHGPVNLKDGRILYAGKNLWREKTWIGVCESKDDGQSWKRLAQIPTRKGDDPKNYHELHAVEAAYGDLIAHIRNHNPKNNRETLQSESRDGGKTWSEPITVSGDGANGDLGYPSTVESQDGTLLTAWYEQMSGRPRAVLRLAKWTLQ